MKVLLRASLMGRGVLSSAGQTRSSHRLLPRLPTSSATMTLPPYASRATDQVRVDGTRNLTTLRCGASRNGLVLAERPGRRAWGWTRHGGIPQGSLARSLTAPPSAGKTELIDPEMGSLYDFPELYDAAFSYRDFSTEAEFLQLLFEDKSGGQPLKSVLDLGCGTGRHIRALASRGVACRGVDMNKAMLEFTRREVERDGLMIELEDGDMRTYSLPDGTEGFDMACILMGTMQHMLTNDDVIAALASAREAVRQGGLVVIELAHPYDLWDGTLAGAEDYPEVWDSDLSDGSKLYVEWGREGDPFDGLMQVLERTVCVTVAKDGKHVKTLMDVCEMRQFSMQELNFAAKLLNLKVVGVYGEMNMSVELDDDEAYRLVMCLQKQ